MRAGRRMTPQVCRPRQGGKKEGREGGREGRERGVSQCHLKQYLRGGFLLEVLLEAFVRQAVLRG